MRLQLFHNFFGRETNLFPFSKLAVKLTHLRDTICKYLLTRIDDKEDMEPNQELFLHQHYLDKQHRLQDLYYFRITFAYPFQKLVYILC